jgi:hypothetical protein
MVETERPNRKTPLKGQKLKRFVKQREPLRTTAYGPPRGKNAIIPTGTGDAAESQRQSHLRIDVCRIGA